MLYSGGVKRLSGHPIEGNGVGTQTNSRVEGQDRRRHGEIWDVQKNEA